MFSKGHKTYSIFTGKCPKCHGESMYKNKNPYIIISSLEINDNCSKCGLKYQIEPSFFYGSMYVSYAVGIAFAVAAFVISYVLLGTGQLTTFFVITGTLLAFLPIIGRLSRNIWINMFVHYDKEAIKRYNDQQNV